VAAGYRERVAKKARHHTISTFLIDRFARTTGRGRLVCQLEKKTGANVWVSPRDATVRKHFYSIEVGGERLPDVENALAQIESMAAPLVSSLDAEGAHLTGQERLEFASFIALTWLRMPFWRERFGSMVHHLTSTMMIETYRHLGPYLRFLRHLGEDMPLEQAEKQRQELVAFLESDDYDIVAPPNLLINHFLESAADVAWIIYMLDWTVVRAPDRKEFILADTPVAQFDPTPLARNGASGLLSSPQAHTFMPLGPRVALHITANPEVWRYFVQNERQLREMTPEEVADEVSGREGRSGEAIPTDEFFDQLNLLSYATAQRYVFGSQNAVCDVHSFAKKNRDNVAYLTPKPPEFHLVEDVPGSKETIRIKRTITIGD
jgi:hypothetical protein